MQNRMSIEIEGSSYAGASSRHHIDMTSTQDLEVSSTRYADELFSYNCLLLAARTVWLLFVSSTSILRHLGSVSKYVSL